MKKVNRFLIGGCFLLLVGCGKAEPTYPIDSIIERDNAEEDLLSDTTDLDEDDVSEFESEEITPPIEIIQDQDDYLEESVTTTNNQEEQEPYLFRFVDVYGEAYETEIKVNAPKTVYQATGFQILNGQTVYEDDVYTSRQGIDVSKHQGKIHWEKVKAAGIEFAILRIGYRGYKDPGTLNLDQQFVQNIEGAKAAGIDVGVYIFSQAVNEEEAREEAEFVIKNLEDYELELPVVYDPESILDAPARTDGVSGEQFTKNTLAFCETIKEAGYEPMIYSNMLWEAFEFDMEQLTEYPFWYADYEPLPQTPYAYEYWQYSNTGHVDGVDGVVDLNIQLIQK